MWRHAQGGAVDKEFAERLAVEYRNARVRMSELAMTLTSDDETRVVRACPDWTVRDLFSHVTGIACDLGSGNPPKGDTQAWVDRQVAERRSRNVESIVEEWNEIAPRFEDQISQAPQQLWGLTYDTVVHEHDLRNAVGNREARTSSGVRLAAELGLKLVKMDLAKTNLASFRAVIDGREHVVGDGEPSLTLTASAFETLRLLGSRRTYDELRNARFDGDLDSHLASVTHMDLPAESLGEVVAE